MESMYQEKRWEPDVENLLLLLTSALHPDQKKELRQPVNWEQVFELARQQNLLALVYEEALGRGELGEFAGRDRYESQTVAAVFAQMQRTASFLALYQSMSREGLRPVVMKGILCRQLYGAYRDHRPSGDEDILIRKTDFGGIRSVLEKQGFQMERKTVTNEQLNHIQEVTFEGGEPPLCLEVHVSPMGRENSRRRNMNRCFAGLFDRTEESVIDGVVLRTMNHTDHFLYLVLHALRHFCGGGFGIRQALDILLYEEAYGGEIDWEYLKPIIKEQDAELFFADLVWIGNHLLGFSLPERKPNCPLDLLEDMIASGVFGNETQEQRTAGQMTAAAIAGERGEKRNGMKVALRTLFPEKSQMMSMHPELAEKGWLLPVRWGQRLGRFIRHNREAGGSLAAASIRISRKRQKLMKKYRLL